MEYRILVSVFVLGISMGNGIFARHICTILHIPHLVTLSPYSMRS